MPNKETELQHLAEADRHIAESEQSITQLRENIAAMQCKGLDSTIAEKFLATMLGTLLAMQEHRNLILRQLEIAD